jgi:VWA domain-containing protein
MSDRPEFTIEIHQNPYIPVDRTEVYAVAKVEAVNSAGTAARAVAAAEVIIIDTSASMAGERLAAAKLAAKTVVDSLHEDVAFAVVAGSGQATMVYPHDPLLARATDERKLLAKSAIGKLSAAGGTRIGHWLTEANRLFADHQHGIRHAILLTDGKNEHEDEAHLGAVLADCRGSFVCDCRGVGVDWEPAELRRVSTELLGGFGMVADPQDLTADFATMIERVMGKAVADVAMRIWTPNDVTVRFVKQMFPAKRALSDGRAETAARPDGPTTTDYPTGIWGAERRDYYLCVKVPALKPHQELLAARVSMVLPGSADAPDVTLADGRVLARWTDDEAQSTRRNPTVEHYSMEEELADSVQVGLGAHREGHRDSAGRAFRRALDLAEQTGNRELSFRIGKLVDPATGAVLPKRDLDTGDIKRLDTESSESAQPAVMDPPARDDDEDKD